MILLKISGLSKSTFYYTLNKNDKDDKNKEIIDKIKEIFNDVTLANAILDRLLYHSHIININGNSYRLKDKLKIDSDVSEYMHN